MPLVVELPVADAAAVPLTLTLELKVGRAPEPIDAADDKAALAAMLEDCEGRLMLRD